MEYPDIEASQPERLPSRPETVFDRWAPVRVIHTLHSLTDGIDARLEIKGRRINAASKEINPEGETVTFSTANLAGSLLSYPELASAFEIFVRVCGHMVEMQDLVDRLRQIDKPQFAGQLGALRDAYRLLDADDKAQLVTKCIQKYPDVWDENSCLAHLGLLI